KRIAAFAANRQSRVNEHAVAVTLDRGREFVSCPPAIDPAVEMARPPIIGGDRIGPRPVAPEHSSEIGAPQRAVFPFVETIAAAGIDCRGGRDLHRSLRALGL